MFKELFAPDLITNEQALKAAIELTMFKKDQICLADGLTGQKCGKKLNIIKHNFCPNGYRWVRDDRHTATIGRHTKVHLHEMPLTEYMSIVFRDTEKPIMLTRYITIRKIVVINTQSTRSTKYCTRSKVFSSVC